MHLGSIYVVFECCFNEMQSCGSVYKLKLNYMHTFSSCHKFSMGFASGLSGGSFPPVDGVVLKKLFCKPGSMLRIIILHELVPSRINLTGKRNQVGFQDTSVRMSIHAHSIQ